MVTTQDGRPFKQWKYTCRDCGKCYYLIFPAPPPKEFWHGPERTRSRCKPRYQLGHRLVLEEP